jgi:hypothetical protein
MTNRIQSFDVIIVGGGASGLMCAISAGKRGRKVLIIDHNDRFGKKILISGGGKCNFSNYEVDAENFISKNPHFVKSAITRFTQWDFIEMINQYKIKFEERTHSQLFCVNSSKEILNMLISECKKVNVNFVSSCDINRVYKNQAFMVETNSGDFKSESLVIATGGLSYQSAGASDFGYLIAKKFDLNIIPQRAGLIPLNFPKKQQKIWSELSGISVNAIVNYKNHSFQNELLFTHKGMSGPVILQISNYWKIGDRIFINFLPNTSTAEQIKNSQNKQSLKNFMKEFLPERLVKIIIDKKIENKPINQYNEKEIELIENIFHNYPIEPSSKLNIQKAEVTLGGVDTNELSSKTFEAKKVKGLFFTGEIIDVSGWLGGYNLQWAWSSGWCAGLYV